MSVRDEGTAEVGTVDGRRVAVATVRAAGAERLAVVEVEAWDRNGACCVRVPGERSIGLPVRGAPARSVWMTRAELRALVLAVEALDVDGGGR